MPINQSSGRLEDSTPYTGQSFSGTDINVLFLLSQVPFIKAAKQPMKLSAEIQTLTVSSTTSVIPVRRVGESKPKAYTRGARTFAGTMIFSVIDKDPFQEIFALDALNSTVINDGSWHIDMMPPFDIVITAVNELGFSGVQLISNVSLTNWGTTYSVDDIYTESTYTYVAEHVSPFVQNPTSSDFLKLLRASVRPGDTPDRLAVRLLSEHGSARPRLSDSVVKKSALDELLNNSGLEEFGFSLSTNAGQVWYNTVWADPGLPLIT